MTEYLLNNTARPVGLMPVALPSYAPGSTVLQVGADKQFKTVGAAVAAAHDGNVVLVDAGTYTNDWATVRSKLTIIGVGGMVNMVATTPPPDQKAMMTVDADLTLMNFSFSGVAVSQQSGANGAGIRYEGGHMVLVNDAFYHNQNGVMGGEGLAGTVHQIEIDHCLFSGNGGGTGNTHNLYVGAVDSLTATNSIFEGANVGHEFKSRALSNVIENNWFRNGPTGTASYEIDLPNGGVDVIRNNVIEKGPMAQNTSMVHFGGEGLPYAGSSLLVTGNTFINDATPATIGVLNHAGVPVTITGNTFQAVAPSLIVKGPGVVSANMAGSGAAIADSASLDAIPGNTTTYTDSTAHTVALTGAMRAVQGGAGRITVTSNEGQSTARGGTGGMDFTELDGSCNNQLSTAAGSVNSIVLVAGGGGGTVISRGTDTITTGIYSTEGQVSGTATINTGSGFDKWLVTGTATINGHGGGPFVTVGATGQVKLTGAIDSLHLQSLGGSATLDYLQTGATAGTSQHMSMSVAGGSVGLTGWQGTLTVSTAAGQQGAVMHLGDGPIQVSSAARDVIWAGAGAAAVTISGQAEVHAGTGALSVFGRGASGDGGKVYGNGGTTVIDGNGGNITYYGGDKASTVQARLSGITLRGGYGRMTVLGGQSEQIIGGLGGLTYSAQGGTAAITTAAGSFNTLQVAGGSVDSWGADTIDALGTVMGETITVHGNATVVGGTGNNRLTLNGRDTATLHGNDSVTVTAGADTTISTDRSACISETGATVRLTLGGAKPASAVVTGGSAFLSANAGRGIDISTDAKSSTSVTLVSGSNTVVARGADLVRGGAGSDSITLTAANTQIWGGAGSMTVTNQDFASGDRQTIHGGTGNITVNNCMGRITFIGGAGNAVVNGLYGALDLTGGTGTLTATAGGQATHYVGGAGTAALTLSSGGGEVTFGSGATTVQLAQWSNATLFDFVAGHGGGTDIIRGFHAGVDRLVLQGVSVQSQSISGGSTNLLLSDGTHVQLAGLTNASRLFA